MGRVRAFGPGGGALLLGALAAAGCLVPSVATGPADPDPVPLPRLVSVTIEYRQPSCFNVSASCEGSVFFWGSWMRPGNEFALTPQPGGFLWTGTARNVPVNFPPRDQPYLVRVYDPYLLETPTAGFTASRLRVGGQAIVWFDSPGTPEEVGLIYIDDNGQGRSPL
jgi:hypothetical protein